MVEVGIHSIKNRTLYRKIARVFAECFLCLGCLTTEYILEVVVADQCSVFFGAESFIMIQDKRDAQEHSGRTRGYTAMQLYPLIPLINVLNHGVNISLR